MPAHYLNSDDGAKATARRFGIDHGAVRRWTEHWKVSGQAGFLMWDNATSSRKAAAILYFRLLLPALSAVGSIFIVRGGILALQDKPRGRSGMSAKKSKSASIPVGQRPDFMNPEYGMAIAVFRWLCAMRDM